MLSYETAARDIKRTKGLERFVVFMHACAHTRPDFLTIHQRAVGLKWKEIKEFQSLIATHHCEAEGRQTEARVQEPLRDCLPFPWEYCPVRKQTSLVPSTDWRRSSCANVFFPPPSPLFSFLLCALVCSHGSQSFHVQSSIQNPTKPGEK